jgi:diguanylate cyclase (GGDEF)-like protein
MAASDRTQRTDEPSQRERPGEAVYPELDGLSAGPLEDRLGEEVNRAGRFGTALSCLLVAIEGLDEIALRHGRELPERALAYAGPALRGELRRFDRVGRASDGELVVLLPGADGPGGEAVARRLLARLRAIKIEAGGVREPLRVSVGLAAWREHLSGRQLVAEARAVARPRRNGGANGFADGPNAG